MRTRGLAGVVAIVLILAVVVAVAKTSHRATASTSALIATVNGQALSARVPVAVFAGERIPVTICLRPNSSARFDRVVLAVAPIGPDVTTGSAQSDRLLLDGTGLTHPAVSPCLGASWVPHAIDGRSVLPVVVVAFAHESAASLSAQRADAGVRATLGEVVIR